MSKLVFSSLITLSLMSSFIFGLVMALMVYGEAVDVGVAILLTISVNFLMWLVGPLITDFINSWFYKVAFMSEDDFKLSHPRVHDLIKNVCDQYKFKFPKIGIIPDRNPTAFTYGSARFNARIVMTEGIFEFLNEDEVRAVVGHELGHIVNRDFIVMMVASTLTQILYEIYATLIKARGKRAGGAKLLALISYVLYIISVYLLYYLSRTREYLADEFSAKLTSAKDLANALIKVAYGIVTVEDDATSKRLLHSTRQLGLVDVEHAKHIGVVSYITNSDPQVVSEVMVFDKVNPWAFLLELNSTHPLTGKRIEALARLGKKIGGEVVYDIDSAINRMSINRSRLFGDFVLDLAFYVLPFFLAVAFFFSFRSLGFAIVGYFTGFIFQLLYRYQFGEPKDTTVLEEMRTPYSSPFRGKPIRLKGEVIGRGVPGYVFSEDMVFKDSTGIIFLDYTSFWGWIGNLFFALGKIKRFFGLPSECSGWFFRGLNSVISLKYLKTDTEVVRSHPILWKVLYNVAVLFLLILFFGTLGL